jgi:DNA-binding MarR family transcriptional regulator
VSVVQWNALREIDRNPGCSQHHLAELTFNSDQAFGTLLNRSHAAGLVEASASVRRATLHRLTTKGKAMLRYGQKVVFKVTDFSFRALTDNRRRTRDASAAPKQSPRCASQGRAWPNRFPSTQTAPRSPKIPTHCKERERALRELIRRRKPWCLSSMKRATYIPRRS